MKLNYLYEEKQKIYEGEIFRTLLSPLTQWAADKKKSSESEAEQALGRARGLFGISNKTSRMKKIAVFLSKKLMEWFQENKLLIYKKTDEQKIKNSISDISGLNSKEPIEPEDFIDEFIKNLINQNFVLHFSALQSKANRAAGLRGGRKTKVNLDLEDYADFLTEPANFILVYLQRLGIIKEYGTEHVNDLSELMAETCFINRDGSKTFSASSGSPPAPSGSPPAPSGSPPAPSGSPPASAPSGGGGGGTP